MTRKEDSSSTKEHGWSIHRAAHRSKAGERIAVLKQGFQAPELLRYGVRVEKRVVPITDEFNAAAVPYCRVTDDYWDRMVIAAELDELLDQGNA
ncbi:MAG: hypothetical protein ACRETO_04855 [Gammaproteobacteria bacterium]